jgi:hypothetical protein
LCQIAGGNRLPFLYQRLFAFRFNREQTQRRPAAALISVGSVLSRLDKFTTFQPGDRLTRNQSPAILAQIMGWSVSATITMAKRYAHNGTVVRGGR